MIQTLIGPSAGSATWVSYTPTVTLVGGSGNIVPQYTTNIGYSSRIGNIIFNMVLLDGDGGNEGAGTGTLNISLFTQASSNNPLYNFNVGNSLNGTTGTAALCGQVSASATTVALVKPNAGAFATFTGADQNNITRTIRLNFFYMG